MSSEKKKERAAFPLLYVFLVGSAVLAIAVSFYHHRIGDDFVFMVEASCDPATSICYVRDCDEEYCPPNGFTNFRIFNLPAKAFERCEDNTCENLCLREEPELCEELICDPTIGDACS